MDTDKKVFSIKEAAKMLGVSEITLYRKTKSKEVKSRKLGSRVLIPAEVIRNFWEV